MTTPEEPIDDELDPEDLQPIPADDENLDDTKLVKLDDLVLSLEESIEKIQTQIEKLDNKHQNKLVRLGKAKARLRIEEKKTIKKKRKKLEKDNDNG